MDSHLSLTFINGQRSDVISVDDRGLNYGDGLFETMRAVGLRIPYREWHLDRLQHGCAQLHIAVDAADVERQLQHALIAVDNRFQHHVVKLMITRGVGERGYKPTIGSIPTVIVRIVATSPPELNAVVSVTLCKHRLSIDPMLAGIKHLNRLDNVLASIEIDGTEFQEGLLFDYNAHLVEAISRNVFIVADNQLLTPRLHEAGVKGVMRRIIMEKYAPALKLDVKEAVVTEQELYCADEVFLCNSVRGIAAVDKIGNHSLSIGPVTRSLQQCWHNDFEG